MGAAITILGCILIYIGVAKSDSSPFDASGDIESIIGLIVVLIGLLWR